MKRATLVYMLGCLLSATAILVAWLWFAPGLVFSAFIAFVALFFMFVIQSLGNISDQTSCVLFFLTTGLVVTLIGIFDEAFLRNNFPYEPFIGVKALAVFVALICPPIAWPAWASFFAMVLIPVITFFRWDAPARTALGVQEPWVTILIVMMSGFVYHHRLRLFEIRDLLVEWRLKSRLQKKLTRSLVSVQHLVNSPIQSIEILMALTNKRTHANHDLIEKSKIHFDQIRKVNQILCKLNDTLESEQGPLSKNTGELENLIQNLIEELKKPVCPISQ